MVWVGRSPNSWLSRTAVLANYVHVVAFSYTRTGRGFLWGGAGGHPNYGENANSGLLKPPVWSMDHSACFSLLTQGYLLKSSTPFPTLFMGSLWKSKAVHRPKRLGAPLPWHLNSVYSSRSSLFQVGAIVTGAWGAIKFLYLYHKQIVPSQEVRSRGTFSMCNVTYCKIWFWALLKLCVREPVAHFISNCTTGFSSESCGQRGRSFIECG